MIDISSLKDSDKGREVVYYPGYGRTKYGILKSWNDTFIFVVFPGGNIEVAANWRDYTAHATRPEHLEFNA